MQTKKREWEAVKPKKSVMQWLLDSDPSIRWQVMRDLTEEPDESVAAERSRVASEGWGARLLDLQAPDGKWGDGTSIPKWESTLYTLLLLRDMGLDPTASKLGRRWTSSATRSPGGRNSVTRRSSGRQAMSRWQHRWLAWLRRRPVTAIGC